jgi:hypothetical protein
VTALCRDCGVLAPRRSDVTGVTRAARRAKSAMPRFTHSRSPTSIATPFRPRSKNAGVPIFPIAQYCR